MRTGWGERGSVGSCLLGDAAAVAGEGLKDVPAGLFGCGFVQPAVLKSSASSMKKPRFAWQQCGKIGSTIALWRSDFWKSRWEWGVPPPHARAGQGRENAG
jgi:hypothetical protein